jgi:hypothetical protein
MHREDQDSDQDELRPVLDCLADAKIYLQGWMKVKELPPAQFQSEYEANKRDLSEAFAIGSLDEYRRFVEKECRYAWRRYRI